MSSNPIEALMKKFNRDDVEARRVKGAVVGCSVLERDRQKFYVVEVENGALKESFWIAHDPSDTQFQQPLPGEWISGYVNNIDDSIAFADLTFQPIFDFTNHTRLSEEGHFAWFRQQAQMKKAP